MLSVGQRLGGRLPVGTDALVGIFVDGERYEEVVDGGSELCLGHSSQAAEQSESLSARQLVDECVELRAVADTAVHLKAAPHVTNSQSHLASATAPTW